MSAQRQTEGTNMMTNFDERRRWFEMNIDLNHPYPESGDDSILLNNFTRSKKRSTTNDDETSEIFHFGCCPICMGEIREATSTKCGHIFCKECLEGALRSHKKCPSCDKQFRGRNPLRRVYLPAIIGNK